MPDSRLPDLHAALPPLRVLLAPHLQAGDLHYFEPYEEVHRHNLATVLDG